VAGDIVGARAKNLIVMKPAVGFMLPSAGVTPAPSNKKSQNGEDALLLSGFRESSGPPCVGPRMC
jgi:hypothetical protein